MSEPVCGFCGLVVYTPDAVEHECCTRSRASGELECNGCSVFKKRWARGETCPHVIGKKRACCKPPKVAA